jgi:hypothetical protein
MDADAAPASTEAVVAGVPMPGVGVETICPIVAVRVALVTSEVGRLSIRPRRSPGRTPAERPMGPDHGARSR